MRYQTLLIGCNGPINDVILSSYEPATDSRPQKSQKRMPPMQKIQPPEQQGPQQVPVSQLEAHQELAILKLLNSRPRSMVEVEIHAQTNWQPCDLGRVRAYMDELVAKSWAALTESRGYALSAAGRDELEQREPHRSRKKFRG